jgi:hypothetical protein
MGDPCEMNNVGMPRAAICHYAHSRLQEPAGETI